MARPFKNGKLIKCIKFCKYCLNHRIYIIYKGHGNDCNYKNCPCRKCRKTTKKLEDMRLRRRIRRQNKRQRSMFNFNVAASSVSHHGRVDAAAGVHERFLNPFRYLDSSYTPSRTASRSSSYSFDDYYRNMLYFGRSRLSSSGDGSLNDEELLSLAFQLGLHFNDSFSGEEDDDLFN